MTPDISMCEGIDCPLKETCYRYLATPSYWQSYSNFYEYIENGKCEHYWECESKSTLKRLDIANKDL